jgi:hypothetical protein
MDVPTSEVGYTWATTGKKNHEVHKGHVVALEEKILTSNSTVLRIAKRPDSYRGTPSLMLGDKLWRYPESLKARLF